MKAAFIIPLFLSFLGFAHPSHAKEPFNIKGIELGNTIDDIKATFEEIEIEAAENKAHCKSGDVVIENGSSFMAEHEDEFQEYSFKMIFVEGVQTVVKQQYSYAASSVSKELFIRRIKEKYDVDIITDDNISEVKNAMPDYDGITHFVVPDGHFFKITDNDVFRLKYASKGHNPLVPGELYQMA